MKNNRASPMYSAASNTPFFIVGPGRSGNTLLRRLLVEKTNACIPDEIYALGDIIRLKKNGLPWGTFVEQAIKLLKDQEDGDLLNANFEELQDHLLGAKKEERTLAALISSFYVFECQSFKKNDFIIGDKTPLNTFSTLDLMKIYPGAKFIYMLRFPPDVIASTLKSGIYKDYNGALDRVQRSYNVYKKIRRMKTVMPVLYEELVKNPEPTLNKVIDFLGLTHHNYSDASALLGDINRHPHHQNVKKQISTSSIGSGLKELPLLNISACGDSVEQYFLFMKDAIIHQIGPNCTTRK